MKPDQKPEVKKPDAAEKPKPQAFNPDDDVIRNGDYYTIDPATMKRTKVKRKVGK